MNFLTATLVLIWSVFGGWYLITSDAVTGFQVLVIVGIILALLIVLDLQGFVNKIKISLVPFHPSDEEDDL